MIQSVIKTISILLFTLITFGEAAPLVITRYHTAANPDTVTKTYTTGTTTVTLPLVEIFISNGVTYTFTLSTTAVATATGDETPTLTGGTQTVVYTDGGDTSTLSPGEEVPTATPTTTPTTTAAPTITTAPQTTTALTTSSSSSDWTSTTETITLTTTVTLDDGSSSTGTSTLTSAFTTEVKDVLPGTKASSSSSVTSKTSSTTPTTTSTTPTTTSTTPTTTSTTPTTTSTTPKTTSTSTTSTSSTTSTKATSTSSLITAPTAIVYSPYNNDGTCKDAAAVKTDLELIHSKNIPTIRVYGTDCNSINTVEPVALELGLKVNQGFWINSDGVDSIDDSVETLITWAQSNSWDIFTFITIGNEAIQSGYASVEELISKISSVKSKLRAAGYTGKVTTSEPPVIFEENPSLCTHSAIDFVGINSHSYFDVNSAASDAGSFVAGQIEIVKNICGDLDIFVTETGYPAAGIQNGKNIPSIANQKIAIQSLLDVVGPDLTILSTYDDLWKSKGSYGIEQSFGVIQLF